MKTCPYCEQHPPNGPPVSHVAPLKPEPHRPFERGAVDIDTGGGTMTGLPEHPF
jgi:hypothetical protein